jgi:hypothetical protein
MPENDTGTPFSKSICRQIVASLPMGQEQTSTTISGIWQSHK